MKKKKTRAEKKQSKNQPVRTRTFELSQKVQDAIAAAVIVIILLIILKPLVIDHLAPQGVDTLASRGASKQIKDFERETGDEALWNPAIFAGMPIYQLKNSVKFSVDDVIDFLGRTLNSTFMYLLIGAIGCFTLMRYLRFSPMIALFTALAFVLMPHYASLYLVGHYAKLRALILMPWVIVAFKYFIDSRSILGAALFALAFGTQIRSHHYQIVFYTAVLIFFIGFYPLLSDLLKKRYRLFMKSSGMLLAALFLGMLMSAQPLLSAREYLPYSVRGKTAIDIDKKMTDAKSDGVSMTYATQWSTHPAEMITWVIPRFFGGTSSEYYQGKEVPQLRNRMIPSYWGHMPFTQSYEYMGVAVLMLAVLGIYRNRKKPLVLSISICMAFFILLSLGRHFETFYALFYNYFPFFNKFRVPMMSVSVTSFIVAVLAGFGLSSLRELNSPEKEEKHDFRYIYYILGGFIAFGIVVFLASNSFSFSSVRDNYAPQVVELIKKIRLELFNQDLIRYFMITVIAGGAILMFYLKKIRFGFLFVLLFGIVLIDMINIHYRYKVDYINPDKQETEYFRKTPTIEFMEQDPDLFRILPVGELFNDNYWCYFNESIGGYSPIKMYTIEEIVTNNLYAGWDTTIPINPNILKILNVRYLVSKMELNRSDLILSHIDSRTNHRVYQYRDFQPRGFFVGETITIPDEYERLETLNREDFDAAKTAIIEEELADNIEVPDSSRVNISEYSVDHIKFSIYSDSQSLFVMSVPYYPPGWKALLDGQPVAKVYKTDHAIQSIIVPPGEHAVTLRFEPDSYYNNLAISYASMSLIYLLILAGLLYHHRERLAQITGKQGSNSA